MKTERINIGIGLTPAQVERRKRMRTAYNMFLEGKNITQISEETGIGRRTVSQYLEDYGVTKEARRRHSPYWRMLDKAYANPQHLVRVDCEPGQSQNSVRSNLSQMIRGSDYAGGDWHIISDRTGRRVWVVFI